MKAVFFDFDGTLTYKGTNIWKKIWQRCGYSIDAKSYYAKLFRSFMSSKISHQDWCNLTCEEFKKAKFDYKTLVELAQDIKLINGLEKTLKTLKNEGYNLYIISGNISAVIDVVLGDKRKYFDEIKANNLQFDKKGRLQSIQGTNYDFEGKAKFILEFKEATNSSAKDLFFVGNGTNDEWAHLSGCNTICINPEGADAGNNTKWHKCIENVDNLEEVLKIILPR